MWRIAMGLGLLVLTACAAPPRPVATMASFTDPACREVARQRSDDSAANFYPRDIQLRVARDSYRSCVALKAPP